MSDFREYSAAFHYTNDDILHYGVKGMRWNHHKNVPRSMAKNSLNSYFTRSNYYRLSGRGQLKPEQVLANEKYIKARDFSNADERNIRVQYDVARRSLDEEVKKGLGNRDLDYINKLQNDKEAAIRELRRRKLSEKKNSAFEKAKKLVNGFLNKRKK